MKKLSVKSVKEKEETMKKCEVQIADMTGTLEKYQQENHKLVAQKDKEIESLRQKIQCVEQTENSSRTEVCVGTLHLLNARTLFFYCLNY